jgi:catechol 2,3-dioxygenase-like lactoylglutathione lyase family enzyme
MRARLDLLTLGVGDLATARAFYVDGLGWPPVLDVPGEVVFVQIGHGVLLSLYGADDLARDTGDAIAGPPPRSVTLGQVVGSEDEVDAVLAAAVAAGGTVVRPGRRMDWGGYSGFFADPDGYRWEIAHNPGFRVAADGTVTIGPVDA